MDSQLEQRGQENKLCDQATAKNQTKLTRAVFWVKSLSPFGPHQTHK